jgi:hypothetical protein
MAKVAFTSTLLAGIVLLASGEVYGQGGRSVPLADVIAQVKKELAAAQNIPGPMAGLSLAGVQLTFAITHSTDVNGKISIGVPIISAELGGSGDRKTEDTSTVTVDLAPPKSSITMSGADSSGFGITQTILAVRKQLASGLKDEPILEPRKASMQFKFGVTTTGGASGQVKFLVFTAGAGATRSAAETSTITLNFEKK